VTCIFGEVNLFVFEEASGRAIQTLVHEIGSVNVELQVLAYRETLAPFSPVVMALFLAHPLHVAEVIASFWSTVCDVFNATRLPALISDQVPPVPTSFWSAVRPWVDFQ
jgi:hypothetical protein